MRSPSVARLDLAPQCPLPLLVLLWSLPLSVVAFGCDRAGARRDGGVDLRSGGSDGSGGLGNTGTGGGAGGGGTGSRGIGSGGGAGSGGVGTATGGRSTGGGVVAGAGGTGTGGSTGAGGAGTAGTGTGGRSTGGGGVAGSGGIAGSGGGAGSGGRGSGGDRDAATDAGQDRADAVDGQTDGADAICVGLAQLSLGGVTWAEQPEGTNTWIERVPAPGGLFRLTITISNLASENFNRYPTITLTTTNALVSFNSTPKILFSILAGQSVPLDWNVTFGSSLAAGTRVQFRAEVSAMEGTLQCPGAPAIDFSVVLQ